MLLTSGLALSLPLLGSVAAAPARHFARDDAKFTEMAPAPRQTDGIEEQSSATIAPTDVPSSTSTPSGGTYNSTVAFDYSTKKIRGVNLGGWLLLESWIRPGLFDATGNDKCVDEYTFTKFQDKDKATEALKKHWDEFVSEKDFEEMAAAGINHVRIPIGYWAYDIQDGEPYISGQEPYLDKAIEWAAKHKIKVMVDLHGVPGSQNGFDNSGKQGDMKWPDDPKNVQRSVDVIHKIALKYSAPEYNQTVTSIGLLNEPAGFKGGDKMKQTIKQYYEDAFKAARLPWEGKKDESGMYIVLHDAFQSLDGFWGNGFMHGDGYDGIGMDVHYYQIFSKDENSWDADKHITQVCTQRDRLAKSPFPVVVGEWSLARTDCAKYLNGRGVGIRFNGTHPDNMDTSFGTCSDFTGEPESFTDEYKDWLRKFWDVQSQTWDENGTGWMFWTWKNEGAAEWSYKAGVDNGWIPKNPEEHKYSLDDICK